MIGVVLIAALVAGCVVLITAVASGEWQVQPILSGSMRPGLPVGGVVAVQRVPTSSLQVRDVVLFHPPGHASDTYVHRIISMTKMPGGYVIKTQGDANRFPDPWTIHFKGRWAYEARFTVPLIGYGAVWVHSPAGRRDLLLAGGSVVMLVAAATFVGEVRRLRRKKSEPADADVATRQEDHSPGAMTAGEASTGGPNGRSRRLHLVDPKRELQAQADLRAPLAQATDRA